VRAEIQSECESESEENAGMVITSVLAVLRDVLARKGYFVKIIRVLVAGEIAIEHL
jgi:hypothetical protein